MYDRKHILELVDWIEREAQSIDVGLLADDPVGTAIAFVILETLLGHKVRRIVVQKRTTVGGREYYTIGATFGADSNNLYREQSSLWSTPGNTDLLREYPWWVNLRWSLYKLRWEISFVPFYAMWYALTACLVLGCTWLFF